MHDDRTLMLLMALPMVVTACPADEAGDAGQTSAGSSGGDAATAGSTSAAMEASTSADDGTTGGDPPPTASSSSSSGGEPPPGDTGTTGGPPEMCGPFPYDPGPISDGCVGYANLLAECYGGGAVPADCIDYYAAECQYMVNYDTMNAGAACEASYADLFACLSGLTCRELEAPTGCETEIMSWMQACFGA